MIQAHRSSSSSAAQAVPGASASAGAEPVNLSRLGVWRGDDWQPNEGGRVQSSGYAALDAQLPGGGWPVGGMSEVLLCAQGHAEWSVVAPALSGVLLAQPRQRAVLVTPPLEIFTPALQAHGIAPSQLCCIAPQAIAPDRSRRGGSASQRAAARIDTRAIWACEQALRCRDVCAVLAWLPGAQPAALRRLQLLAAQQRQLLWVFRPEVVREQSSPAPLRLALEARDQRLLVHVIKRRGPTRIEPVELPLLHAQLQAELEAQALRRAQAQQEADALLVTRDVLTHAVKQISKDKRHALASLAFTALR